MARKDIYSILRAEHREASDLLKKIEKTKDPEQREELFEEVKEALLLHSKAEEKVFYAELRKHEELRDLIKEAKQEHTKVERQLKALERLDKDDEEFLEKLRELRQDVEHHISEEEGEIFKRARKVIDQDEARSLGQRFEDQEHQLAA